MKSKKIVLGVLQAMIASAALLVIPSCASTDDDNQVQHPKDDVSGLPWNRPAPGEDAQRFGGLPQSR